jgi:hypothetical protein
VKACDPEGLKLTGLVANIEGEYILQLTYLGATYSLTKSFEVDEELIFSTETLNENYNYKGQLLDPNGDIVIFTIGEDETLYDCFTFTTAEAYSLN